MVTFDKRFFLTAVILTFICTSNFGKLYADETCDAENADRWKYLWQNPSLESRQLIATGFLKSKGIKTVIEIGGYCTPVCRYAPDIKYINIDPFVNSHPAICKNATLIRKGFENVKLSDLPIEKPYAVVMIGIGWDNMRNKLKTIANDKFLNEAIKGASVIVAEATYTAKWTSEQAEVIEKLSYKHGLKKKIDLDVDIQGKRPMANVYNRHLRIFARD